ncbi:hypothetical protein GC174_07820 [bacterium]|nr:hypothetical protein [bacterium]
MLPKSRSRSNLSLAGILLMLMICCQGQASADAKDPDALELYKSKNFLKAAKAFTSLIDSDKGGKDPVNYFNLGNCYYQLSYPTRARHMYALTIKKFPHSQEAEYAKQMIARIDSQSAITMPEKNLTSSKVVKLDKLARAIEQPSSGSPEPGSRSESSQINSLSAFLEKDLPSLPNENRIYFQPGSQGHMLVDIYLNNRKMQAWFDTGANAHFGLNHLQAAGVELPRGKPNSTSSGWAGNSIAAWRQMMKIRIGNMERTVPVTIEENMSLMPLVGQGFLHGYDYEIHNNGPQKYLTMKKRTAANTAGSHGSSTSDLYDVPCTTKNFRDYVKLTVNGRQEEVLLDTGSNGTILSTQAAKRLGLHVPDDAPTRTGSGVGGSITWKIIYADVKIGPIYERGFPIQVGGGSDMSAIGQDLLNKKRYTIDRERKLLRFFH